MHPQAKESWSPFRYTLPASASTQNKTIEFSSLSSSSLFFFLIL